METTEQREIHVRPSTPADLGALLSNDLQNGPLTVSVVGVVTPDPAGQAIPSHPVHG